MDTCCLLAWTVTWALLVEPKVLGCPVLGHPKLSGVLLQALVRGDLTPGNVHHGGPRRGTPRPTIWCSCVPALLALALQLLSLELRQSAFPNLPTLGGREVGPSAGETKPLGVVQPLTAVGYINIRVTRTSKTSGKTSASDRRRSRSVRRLMRGLCSLRTLGSVFHGCTN